MSPYVKHTVEALECECLRCGYRWWSFAVPKSCSKCKSRLWDTPRTRKLYPSPGARRQRKWRKRLRAEAKARKVTGDTKS